MYCHLSSEVEQCFRKAEVLGSIPRGGSNMEEYNAQLKNLNNKVLAVENHL